MKKPKIRIRLLIWILLFITVSVWLATEFNKKRLYIENLQLELSLERRLKEFVQQELDSTKNRLEGIRTELGHTRRHLGKVNRKLTAAENNNVKLLEEKRALEAKLHSLTELKAAIREVKKEMRQERYQQILAEKQTQKEADAYELASGNRGFLLKNGKPTYKPRVRIEVQSD